MLLLDPSKTNFSGWRGAIDQARIGFRRLQRGLIDGFYSPVYAWKVRQWLATDPELAALAASEGCDPLAHRFNPPTWDYIEPGKDAAADATVLNTRLNSPLRLHARRGRNWEEIAPEIVEDNRLIVSIACETAAELNAKYPGARVDWRELAGFDPKGRTPEVRSQAIDDIGKAVRAGVPVEIAKARASLGLDPEVRPGAATLRFNDQDFLEYHMRLGIVTINEARERLGLPPIEGGEVRVGTTSGSGDAVGGSNAGDGGGSGDGEADSEGDTDAEDDEEGT